MKDIDMEARLHDYYGTFTPDDSGRAVAGVGRVVADARGRAPWTLGAWLGHRRLRGAAVVAATAVLVLALAAPLWFGSITGPAATSSAASPTPSPSASASPSAPATMPSPVAVAPTATLGPAKCESFPETISYGAVGWRWSRVVVVAVHYIGCGMSQELLSVDPAVGQWRTELPLTDALGDWLTDGSSLALSGDGFLVVDAAGKSHSIPGNFGGYRLSVLPGGGYLVVGADKLYRIASDGIGVTSDPLPAGYVIVAPTSDPNMFILATAAEANTANGLSWRSPFEAYLWNIRTGHLKLVASAVGSVERSPNSLAYLDVVTDSAWSTLSLAGDGSVVPVARPIVAGISPDGSHYLHSSDPSSVGAVTFQMRLTSTNQVLSEFQGYNGGIVWSGNTAALVSGPAPDEATGAGAGQERLVIVDGATVKRVPLP